MAIGTEPTFDEQVGNRFVGAVVVPADQAVYALTNLVPLIPLSRSLDSVEFGQVALAQSLVVGLAVLGRAYFATPLLAAARAVGIRSTTIAGLTRLSAVAAAVGAIALLILAAIPALPLPGPATMLVLCFGLPVVFPIEIKRMSFIRADRPLWALATDGTWLIAEVAVFVIGPLIGVSLGTAALASWSIGAVAAAVVAFFLSTQAPPLRADSSPSGQAAGPDAGTEPAGTLERLTELGRGFLAEAVLLVARVQGYFFTVALVSGAAALGGVRFAFALVAPVNTALAGWRTYATGQFRRQLNSGAPTNVISPLIAGPPLLVAVGLVVVAAVVPDRLIDSISGNANAGPYLFPVAAAIALSAIDIVVQAFLAARELTSQLWMVRVVEVAAWLLLLIAAQPSTPSLIGRLLLTAAAISTTAWIVVYGLIRRKDHH